MRGRINALLIVATAVLILALTRAHRTRADEDEEKPITSSAAQISRDAAGHVFIAIRPAAQKEIGLITQTLAPVVRAVEVEGYGLVLDPAPLSKLNGDLLSAQAALAASRAEFGRARRLYAEQKNVSLRNLQTAQANYLTDKARFDALDQQLRDTWGIEIARAGPRTRSDLIRALVDRREALARVTVPPGEVLDGVPRRAEVVALGHEDHPLPARAIYYAPTVGPKMQGQPFLLLIGTSKLAVRPGTAVSARLSTSRGAEHGVMVPRSAVVRYAGKEWVYQKLGAGRFTRREIVPTQLTRHGYFVTKGLAAGTRIVVTGAQSLLSQELKARIRMGD